MKKVVIDANIFVKLFREEHDSKQALELIEKVSDEAMEILAPCVVINEVMYACEYRKIDTQPAFEFFRTLLDYNLELINTSSDILEKTFEITQYGHKNSGYPTFSDSMYHAVALEHNALFITDDTKHIEKGRIQLASATV